MYYASIDKFYTVAESWISVSAVIFYPIWVSQWSADLTTLNLFWERGEP